jgi:hypothetical protein
VAEQVWGYDNVRLGQPFDDPVPLRRSARHAVNQHHRGALAGDCEHHAMAV